MNVSATISWSMLWSAYNNAQIDPFQGVGWGPGLVYAWQPWSGAFNVTPAVWAAAHTTQFVHPGWVMPWAAAGHLARGGSFVSYLSPDGADFAVVLETAVASCAHCAYASDTAASEAQPFVLRLGGGLQNRTSLGVWRSNSSVQFERLDDVAVGSDGRVAVTVQPGAIYTLASAAGRQQRGAPTAARPAAPFPACHSDDFDETAIGAPGRYWADQCGSFEVAPALGRAGRALAQRVARRPGTNRWDANLAHPITVLGDALEAAPQRLSAKVLPLPPFHAPSDVVVEQVPDTSAAWAGICGRVSSTVYYRNISAVCLRLVEGGWQLVENTTRELGAGALPAPRNGSVPWRSLTLDFQSGQKVEAWVDDERLGAFAVGARSGMFGLASGWNEAQFDHVVMAPLTE